MARIDDILADFAILDDWEDRYRYVIELGRGLEPLPEEGRNAATRVEGCVSQVWLLTCIDRGGEAPCLSFRGDSDAHIVRGLVAILIALFSGRKAGAILELDPDPVFTRLGLRDHLTPQRSNGLTAMVRRIKSDAEAALASAEA